jgi:hypothetical protein
VVYKTEKPVESKTEKPFPSSTEVDRVFYDKPEFTVEPEGVMFSSPLEVNRLVYESFKKVKK